MMAIETAHAGSTQSSAVSGANQALKSRSGKGADATAGAGTFSSLLNGMGMQADEDALAVQTSDVQSDSKAAEAGDAGKGQPVAPDAALLAGVGIGQAPAADPADAGSAQANSLPGRAARVGGANAQGPQDAGVAGAQAAAGEAPGRLQSAGAFAGQESADSIAELVAGLKAPSTNAKAAGPLDLLQGAATHTPTVGLARGGAQPFGFSRTTASRGAGLDPASAAGSNSGMSFGAGLGGALGTLGLGRGAAAQADARDARLAGSASFAAAGESTTSATAQLLAAMDAGGSGAQDKSGSKPGGQSGGESLATGALPGVASDPAGPSSSGSLGELDFAAALAAQPMTPEEMVASQVSYLVTQKTQSAELKLDGFGDQPVEVSISMNGNEAQVAFRSDHAQARELLEGAMPHLKEMLQSEGLLLSGMSVGTSGRGGADAGGQQAKGEAGGAAGKPEPLAAQAMAPRVTKPQGMVDVFA